MAAVYHVGEHAYTPRQATVLCKLLKGPMSVDGLNGWDRNSLSALSDRDVIDLNDTRAVINDAGRKVVIELNKKVNGAASPAPEKMPAAQVRTSRASTRTRAPSDSGPSAGTNTGDSRERPALAPPQGRVLDLDKLKAAVEAQYRSDLASIERLAEISAEIAE
jgi:hypothetical protein